MQERKTASPFSMLSDSYWLKTMYRTALLLAGHNLEILELEPEAYFWYQYSLTLQEALNGQPILQRGNGIRNGRVYNSTCVPLKLLLMSLTASYKTSILSTVITSNRT